MYSHLGQKFKLAELFTIITIFINATILRCMKMINLRIPPEKAIFQIIERIEEIKTIKKNQYGLDYYDFISWCSKTWAVIDGIYGSDDPHSEELRTLALSNCSCNSPMQAVFLTEVYHSRLWDFINEIRESRNIPE
jgi:hypothetical protein